MEPVRLAPRALREDIPASGCFGRNNLFVLTSQYTTMNDQDEREPHVVYVDDWANPPADDDDDDDDVPTIMPDRVADNFVDWLSRQAEWLLSSPPRRQHYEAASKGRT